MTFSPCWRSLGCRIPESARRLRSRIELVFDFAIARGWRSAPNPARWRDLRHDLPLASKLHSVAHHPSLLWQQLPLFMAELRRHKLGTARALDFLVLTASRANEVTGATWREINLDTATWTIPSTRMKSGRQHRVPLPSAAVAVLGHVQPLMQVPDDYLFPGRFPRRPMATMALFSLLRRMQGGADGPYWIDALGRPITVHGFRATFRSWAADLAMYPREVTEAALAHVLGSRVRACLSA